MEQSGHAGTGSGDCPDGNFLHLADADYPASLFGTPNVGLPPFAACAFADYLRGGVPCHGTCAGGGVLRGGDALCRDCGSPFGFSCLGRHPGRLPVCLLVDAREAVALFAADYCGDRGFGSVFAVFLFHAVGRCVLCAALPAGGMPRVCLRGFERDVHDLPGGVDDIPAFFSGIERVQYAPHGGGRGDGSRPLQPRAVLLHGGQPVPLRGKH